MLRDDISSNSSNPSAPAYPNLSGVVSDAAQSFLSQARSVINMPGLTSQPNDLTLRDAVRVSPHENSDSVRRSEYILSEFNKFIAKGDSCFTTSYVRGDLINPSSFLLGHKNQKPELIGPMSNRYVARQLTGDPTVKSEIIGEHSQNETYFGAYGVHVINVPIGKFAVGMSGNIPLMFGPGPHVVHDSLFKFDIAAAFYNQAEVYIKHGNLNILRIPYGSFAKIMIGTKPLILEARAEPYVFNDPLFKFDLATGLVDQTTPYIKHGTINVLRVPVGKVAKVWNGTEPEVLEYRPEPYVYNNPLFKFDAETGYVDKTTPYIQHGIIHVLRIPAGKMAAIWNGNAPMLLPSRPEPYEFKDSLIRFAKFNTPDGFIDQSEPYIQHGTIHILRIPAGKIATVWDGAQPVFLESRPEPYEFNSPIFRLAKKSATELFYNSTDPLIKHGFKKRLMVHTGQVAVTWDNGVLQVIEPRIDATPTMIESPNHEVSDEFLSTGMMNLEFPSKLTKSKRLEDNAKSSTDELSYELFTTKDSLKVGVKLYVAIRISNPQLALSKLINLAGIMDHVESCATVDMGMAIQQCTSQEFLNSYQTKPSQRKPDYAQQLYGNQDVEPENMDLSIQDKVKKKLSKDLEDIGIELIRMNFESPRIIDPEIAKKMSEQSLATAEASSKEALLEKNFRIANRNAEQEANTKKIAAEQEARTKQIAQDQVNSAKVSQAQAEKDSAKLIAEALIMRAEAEKQAALLRGQPYIDNPRLFDMEMMRIQMGALATAHVVPPQVASLLTSGMFASPFTLFNGGQQVGTSSAQIIELQGASAKKDEREQSTTLRAK